MTFGVTEVEYPIPPLFIVTDVIVPFVIFAVATAVDPIPVATGDTFIGTGGCEICTEVELPTYPLPPSTTAIAEIVPAVDTVAVNDADIGFVSFTIKPSKFISLTEESSFASYWKKLASST